MRDGLRHAAACPARTHMECPTFRRYLNAALRLTARTSAPASLARAAAAPRRSKRARG
jgi:hypothetical protein